MVVPSNGIGSTRAKGRFSKWLKKMFEKGPEAYNKMGVDIKDISTHSFRKAVASTAQW